MTRQELEAVFKGGCVVKRKGHAIGVGLVLQDLEKMGFTKIELKRMERDGTLMRVYVRMGGPTRVLFMLPDYEALAAESKREAEAKALSQQKELVEKETRKAI